MSGRGIVSWCVDPDQAIVPSPQFIAGTLALAPDRLVRVPIKGSHANTAELPLYTRAIGAYTAAGARLYGVLDLDFNRPWLEGAPARVVYPNEALGYAGNKRQNRWIKDSCVRAAHVARALAPAGLTRYFLGNEPNLRACIAPGANVPPASDEKAPAMAPEVYFSYAYELAGYLRHAGATETILGAFSWLPNSGDDRANPYGAQYIRRGLMYLRATGVQYFPWTALALNCEGTWTPARAGAMVGAIRRELAPFGFAPDFPIVIGEWGWRVGSGIDRAAARQTYAALAGVARDLFFFQFPAGTNNDPTGYGANLATVAGGVFGVGAPMPWAGVLDDLYRGL